MCTAAIKWRKSAAILPVCKWWKMEAAAIAQACAQLEVPFVVVRAVSDLADEKADVSFETFLETASVHSAQTVRSIIEAL